MLRKLAIVAIITALSAPAFAAPQYGQRATGRFKAAPNSMLGRALKGIGTEIRHGVQSVQARSFVTSATWQKSAYKRLYRDVEKKAFAKTPTGQGKRRYPNIGKVGFYEMRLDLRTAGKVAQLAVLERAIKDKMPMSDGVKAHAGRLGQQVRRSQTLRTMVDSIK